MLYVSAQLSEGLGNRFFQVAAMLGYAAAYGHKPVFIRCWISENKSHPGPCTIFDFFPDIPVLDMPPSNNWTVVKECYDDAFTFRTLAKYDTCVKLEGCFQSEKYFPPILMIPRILTTHTKMLGDLRSAVFLHVRRGDYLLPYCRHHCVDLRAYYRRALTCVGDEPIFVCSDDIDWCKQTLPFLYGDLISHKNWMFAEGLTDVETLAAMIQCGRGAICANSTFSWWGAYWGTAKEKFMPATWGHPPLPPARDLYPDGVSVLPT